MQLPTVVSSLLLLGGLAVAAPVADVVEEPCDERVICIDAINACGIKYGGCYDVCKVSAKPVAPPCPATATQTKISTKITQLPTHTAVKSSTKKASTSTKRSLATSTRRATATSTKKASTTTKKATSTKKSITTSTKKPTVTPKPFTTSVPTLKPTSTCNGSGMTLCWDAINECGQMYGACFPDCKPWPTPSAPPCRITTTKLIPLPGGPVPVPTDYPILTVAQE
ncbi:hypothetical protein QBC35DRAFT_101515 [Podospora australis]|uniref:Uncharacterized protein n=1 Tax=Podospora australis TaxID=1536484 RepID=A0AAN7ANJ7_9PEZI|nr:hypothetical protein QBC35DRAFT_101515 [Podospora australis]